MDSSAGRQVDGGLEGARSARSPGQLRTARSSRAVTARTCTTSARLRKHDFRNFEFSAEVMTSPGANSGIYVHTKWQPEGWPVAGYELQVINSNPPAENDQRLHRAQDDRQHLRGAQYLGSAAPRTTSGSTTAFVSWARPSRPSSTTSSSASTRSRKMRSGRRQEGPASGVGHFALQAHDPGSVVKYRNMKVRILPRQAAPPAGLVPIADRSSTNW